MIFATSASLQILTIVRSATSFLQQAFQSNHRRMLQIRGIQLQPNLCLLCDSSVENMKYLFLHCDFVWHIWSIFGHRLRMVVAKDLEEQLIAWFIIDLWGETQKDILYATLSSIWVHNVLANGCRIKRRKDLILAIKQFLIPWSRDRETFSGYSS